VTVTVTVTAAKAFLYALGRSMRVIRWSHANMLLEPLGSERVIEMDIPVHMPDSHANCSKEIPIGILLSGKDY
jgi:hypothetical protein